MSSDCPDPGALRVIRALVLAGDRTSADPVAAAAGVPCKAAAPVAGIPMLTRVLATLRSVPEIERILVVGPTDAAFENSPELHTGVQGPRVARMAPRPSPSLSAAAGLAALGPGRPVFLTTADHALLTPALATRFIVASRDTGADITVGLVPYGIVQAAFPGVRRTVLRFRDGDYCTCNLFAVWSPRGARVIDFWVRVEQQRKHPARLVAGVLGLGGLLAYLVGILTLHGALARASKRLGARIQAVILDDAEAGVDVDTPDDLRRAEAILARREAR